MAKQGIATRLFAICAGVVVALQVGRADERPPIPVVNPDAVPVVGRQRDSAEGVGPRIEHFNKLAKEGGFDVLFIGDSITHCWEDHGKKVWEKKIAPFNAVNFGIGGDTTQTVIWRLDNGNLAGKLNPKVVVLMLGTNNNGDNPEETAAGIGAILERLHVRLPDAKILLFSIFPRQAPDSPKRRANDEVNRIISKYHGYWNIRYIDIASKMTDEKGNLLPGLTWDGLHLAEKGYEVWADVLVPVLNEIVNKNVVKDSAGAERLWDMERSLWEEVGAYRIERPLHPEFGWEGPRATVFEPGSGKGGCNISNERLESSLWGLPDRLVFSFGKTDVFNRAKLSHDRGKRPVGQLLVMAEDFSGAAQPSVSTELRNGENTLHLEKGAATADVGVVLSDCESNVLALKMSCAHLSKPILFRLYRHNDTMGDMVSPQAGCGAGYFWIRQQFTAENTFPEGFDYVLMAKVAGVKSEIEAVDGQPNLGAPVPFRDKEWKGSAATARIDPAVASNLVVYITVVTRAESGDPMNEAKKRLAEAERRGYAELLGDKEKWCKELFVRREQGRIFTGNFGDVKDVVLPFIYQGSFQSRHIYNSNPDPRRYESDAGYGILEIDRAAWCGLQCFNEELYTGDFVVGRDEAVIPYYVNLFNMYRPVFEGYAKDRGFDGLLVLRGYVPPVKMEKYWSPDAPANSRDACDWATLVWSFKNVWDAFDYGGYSPDYLRETVYPSLRGIADFFASLVKPGEDGCYHIEQSQIREEDMGRDAVDCIAAAKWAFKRAIEASELLDVDEARRKVWAERLEKMAPYYIIKNGQGEEVIASLVKNGTPVVAGHGTTHFVVNVADEINLDSSEREKVLAVRSNLFQYEQPMNRQVEFLLGREPDKLCGSSVFAHPAWLIHYAQESGTGDYSRMLPLETKAQKTIACWLEPERLCNSRSGTIHFFPCVPRDFDVAFRDFQARGGFLVSAELRGGAVTFVRIKARRDGKCRVMNPWPGRELKVSEAGGQEDVSVVKEKGSERYSFGVVAGREYELTIAPGKAGE